MKKIRTEVETRNQKMELRRLAAYGQRLMRQKAHKQAEEAKEEK